MKKMMAGIRISLVWLLYTAWKTIFSFPKCFEKMVFSKKLHGNMIFLVLFIFAENMIFFFERKVKDDFSQEINVNMIFSVYMYKCYKYDITVLPKKNQIWSSSEKIHLKVIDILDWHSRKNSNDSLYFSEELHRRFHTI